MAKYNTRFIKKSSQLNRDIQSYRCKDFSVKQVSGLMGRREGGGEVGFGRLCSKKKHIMLLAMLIFFRNYAKIMLLSENYALCHRNYAT